MLPLPGLDPPDPIVTAYVPGATVTAVSDDGDGPPGPSGKEDLYPPAPPPPPEPTPPAPPPPTTKKSHATGPSVTIKFMDELNTW